METTLATVVAVERTKTTPSVLPCVSMMGATMPETGMMSAEAAMSMERRSMTFMAGETMTAEAGCAVALMTMLGMMPVLSCGFSIRFSTVMSRARGRRAMMSVAGPC
jgi:hypothetical protein